MLVVLFRSKDIRGGRSFVLFWYFLYSIHYVTKLISSRNPF